MFYAQSTIITVRRRREWYPNDDIEQSIVSPQTTPSDYTELSITIHSPRSTRVPKWLHWTKHTQSTDDTSTQRDYTKQSIVSPRSTRVPKWLHWTKHPRSTRVPKWQHWTKHTQSTDDTSTQGTTLNKAYTVHRRHEYPSDYTEQSIHSPQTTRVPKGTTLNKASLVHGRHEYPSDYTEQSIAMHSPQMTWVVPKWLQWTKHRYSPQTTRVPTWLHWTKHRYTQSTHRCTPLYTAPCRFG